MLRPHSQSTFASVVSNRYMESGVTGCRKKSLYDRKDPEDQRCQDFYVLVINRFQASCQPPPNLVTLILHRASFPWSCDRNNCITVVWTPVSSNTSFSTTGNSPTPRPRYALLTRLHPLLMVVPLTKLVSATMWVARVVAS